MKKLLPLLLIIIITGILNAAIIKTPGTDAEAKFIAPLSMNDSLRNIVSLDQANDSLAITIWASGGAVFQDRMLLSDARVVISTYNDQDWMAFIDDFQDINGTGGAGNYAWEARLYDATFDWWYSAGGGQYNGTSQSLEDQLTKITEALDSVNSVLDSISVKFGDRTAFNYATENVTVGTNNDKTAYSLSGTITTLDGLNNFDPTTDQVIVATNNDKTDYALSTTSRDDVINNLIADLLNYSLKDNNWDDPLQDGKVGYIWFWAGDSSNFINAAFFTLSPGSKTYNDKYSDEDTLWFVMNGDTIGGQVYKHPGGIPGGAPDSVIGIGPPQP